jgi:hypothetical protein
VEDSSVDKSANLRQIVGTPISLIRATERFFRGVLHPHLLGVCCPDHFFRPVASPKLQIFFTETIDGIGSLD